MKTTQKEAFDLVLMKFIDAHLDLYGHIQTKTICDQFYMHRTRASAAMTKYREFKPSNTRFNVTEKRHDKSYTFEKVFLKTSSLEYLNSVELVFEQDLEN
ncbi:hypothetical protein [Vibrio vulnificus]|uniref:hypothetical protein n=1 Tax=Vibrio vulnificus TaxID=672 RepID=UPI001022DE1E|nr:hypothetical protein [Vibrio vulnificus]RZQ33220.1 hypothetical protein D8T38_18430 [Vibrio vulnificus]